MINNPFFNRQLSVNQTLKIENSSLNTENVDLHHTDKVCEYRKSLQK